MRFARSLAPRRDEQTLQRALSSISSCAPLVAWSGLRYRMVAGEARSKPIFKGLGVMPDTEPPLITSDGKFFLLLNTFALGPRTAMRTQFRQCLIAAFWGWLINQKHVAV